MARDSFNEQKNKNVYSTKKKKKKQTTKTVVKKPQSSSVSKETTQEQRINQKTYGQPTKPAYKNNKAKTSNEQRKQNTEDNNRLKQTVARQSRERTADTSREMKVFYKHCSIRRQIDCDILFPLWHIPADSSFQF